MNTHSSSTIDNAYAGLFGVEFVNDTAAHLGNFCRIYAVTATTIAAATCGSLKGSLAGVVVPIGTKLDIPNITSITLTSGTCLLYTIP